MRIPLFLPFISLLLCVLYLPGQVHSEPRRIKSCGMAQIIDGNIGRAKTNALSDAQRNAVQKGIGTLISSQTLVKNAILISDRIYSQASGYVTDYRIVSEGPTPSGTMYELCIEGTVDIADIKDDLRAIGILKRKVGNPRFMTIYLPEIHGGSEKDALVIKSAQNVINEVFLEKGFIVLDKMFVQGFVNEVTRNGDGDLGSISTLALKYQADLLLIFDIDASERTDFSSKFFKEIRLSMDIRAVAPATADIIAAEGKSKLVRTSKKTKSNYLESTVIAGPVTTLAKQVSEGLLEDTLAYFERQSNEGTRLSCRFIGFKQDEMYSIVEVIENMNGYKDKNIRTQSTDSILLDVNYLGKQFDFQRELKSGLEKRGIDIHIRESNSNEFIIYKP